MIRHIVLWKLLPVAEGADAKTNAQRIKNALEDLTNKVPEIRHLEVGINCLPGDSNAEVSLLCDFDDLAALQRYQDHPEHLKVAALIGQLRSSRSAIDYEF